jgi:DNA repair exonuclease SbcCD ATPase subunit
MSLTVQGFGSINELYLPLNTPGITLIRGANGQGKSSILSALVWGLYGKNLKEVPDVNTWENIRPKNYMGTKVEIYFKVKDDIYQIIRCQKYKGILEDGSKGNDRLIILKNAEMIPVKGKTQIQDQINKALGLSYNLFMNSIMFGQGLKRMIQESNSDKKKLFEEVFNLEYLNIAKGIALQDKNNIISEINEIEKESSVLRAQLDENRKTYFDLREREKTFKARIKKESRDLKEERKSLTKLLIKKNQQIKDEVDQSLQQKIQNTQNHISKYTAKIKKVKSLSLENVVDETIELLKHKDYNTAITKLQRIRRLYKNIIKYSDRVNELRERLDSLRKIDQLYDKLKTECEDISDDLAQIDQDIKNLKEEKLSVMSPKYKEKLKEIRKRLRKVDEDYHNKDLELKDYDWLINDPLGNNGIKAYLFDSSLYLLNKTLESYSDLLGFRIEFNINLGSARKDFVTLIEMNGRIVEYSELSGGQKQLANVAMAFAMHQSLSASKGINVAFLDEVFESLSPDNIELICSLIKHIFSDKSLFLISHLESLPFGNCRTLQVEMINGLSNYKSI